MKTANNLSLSLVGAIVKTYIAFGLLWSKADAVYRSAKSIARPVAVRSNLQSTVK